ncbi:MAG: hypothetical protein IKO45_00485 [Clostridia bacterium]|nr:hypothetical protein [Clostridia bacterium]
MNDNREKTDMFLEDERLDPLYQDLVPDAPDFVETSVRRIKAMKRTRTRRLISSIGGIAAVLLVFAAVRTAPLLFGGSKKSAMKDDMISPTASYSISFDDTANEMAPEPGSAEAEAIPAGDTKNCAPEPNGFFAASGKNGKEESEEIEEVYIFEEDDWKELYDLIITDHKADNFVGYMEMEDGIKLKNFLKGKERLLELVKSESLRDILSMIENDRVIIYFK